MFQIQLLFKDCREDIGRDRYPYLGFDRVFRPPEKIADAKVLLDPLEKELDRPLGPVEFGNDERACRHVVRHERQVFLRFLVIMPHSPDSFGILFFGFRSREFHNLVRTYSRFFV